MKFNTNSTRFTKGFTLIELLVVIAIIGILSSIVLASLSTARTKANDSKVQEQMQSLRSAAEIYYSTNSAYETVAVASTTIGAAAFAAASSTSFLNDSASGGFGIAYAIITTSGVTNAATHAAVYPSYWVAAATLPSGAFWCVDSSGKSESLTSGQFATAGVSTLCP